MKTVLELSYAQRLFPNKPLDSKREGLNHAGCAASEGKEMNHNVEAAAMPQAARPGSASVSELEAHLGYWLRFVSSHVSHSFQKKAEANGVTISEWVVLREMFRLGCTSPTVLAHVAGMSKGAVSKLIDRLESKGMVSKSILLADRRQHSIELTTEGEALVPVLAEMADQNDEEFFGKLPRQLREGLLEAMKEVARTHHLKNAPLN
ncbi:MarR family winged helix-turn-helix transcriptional regulator [Janthinobacterium sp. HLX7-2]|uniref:MarR family winged helix-turn-helix transcriptional regulator n=1 Tax=Janthinobacterium sp. HLX7-2 TaxID=1259331 RepID=UPI003F214947